MAMLTEGGVGSLLKAEGDHFENIDDCSTLQIVNIRRVPAK
jgi:hypothetical protein